MSDTDPVTRLRQRGDLFEHRLLRSTEAAPLAEEDDVVMWRVSGACRLVHQEPLRNSNVPLVVLARKVRVAASISEAAVPSGIRCLEQVAGDVVPVHREVGTR